MLNGRYPAFSTQKRTDRYRPRTCHRKALKNMRTAAGWILIEAALGPWKTGSKRAERQDG
ncbi:hypothetical protein RHIZ404_230441 [Rhizobium sp. EC-SD404]|nr:hypothetical protein RHIZ404_230441 [Rhizobium sp. EC-SD404]